MLDVCSHVARLISTTPCRHVAKPNRLKPCSHVAMQFIMYKHIRIDHIAETEKQNCQKEFVALTQSQQQGNTGVCYSQTKIQNC